MALSSDLLGSAPLIEIKESYADPATEYALLQKDVYAEMYNVFGTSDAHSANAKYETFKLMLTDPAFFENEGLFDDDDNALDTALKVTTYANAKMLEAKTYSVFRMKKIKEFKDKIK